MMSDGITTTMPLQPARENGGGESWMWIILIVLLLGGNGNSLLGGGGNSLLGGGANAAQQTINTDLIFAQMNNGFNGVNQNINGVQTAVLNQTNQLQQAVGTGLNGVNLSLCNLGHQVENSANGVHNAVLNQTNQLQQTLSNGFNGVTLSMCNLGHQMDNGFGTVARGIDQLRFETAQSTCEITNAIHEEGRLTRDLITANTIQELRDRNLELSSALNNSAQTAAIVSQIRPYPAPAYLTVPPNAPVQYAYNNCAQPIQHPHCNPLCA